MSKVILDIPETLEPASKAYCIDALRTIVVGDNATTISQKLQALVNTGLGVDDIALPSGKTIEFTFNVTVKVEN